MKKILPITSAFSAGLALEAALRNTKAQGRWSNLRSQLSGFPDSIQKLGGN